MTFSFSSKFSTINLTRKILQTWPHLSQRRADFSNTVGSRDILLTQMESSIRELPPKFTQRRGPCTRQCPYQDVFMSNSVSKGHREVFAPYWKHHFNLGSLSIFWSVIFSMEEVPIERPYVYLWRDFGHTSWMQSLLERLKIHWAESISCGKQIFDTLFFWNTQSSNLINPKIGF